MPTIRTPRGLALTLLGTLALVVLTIGVSSAKELVIGYDAFVSWLRSPALAVTVLVAGLAFWAALALVSYGLRITGPRSVVAAGVVLVGLASTNSTTDWDLPIRRERLVSATWLREQPPGLLGTRWKGIQLPCQVELVDLRILPSGRVVTRVWPAPSSGLIVPLIAFRVTPPTEPYVATGRLRGDLLYWDHGRVERVWREGDELRIGYVPHAAVTTGPLPTDG